MVNGTSSCWIRSLPKRSSRIEECWVKNVIPKEVLPIKESLLLWQRSMTSVFESVLTESSHSRMDLSQDGTRHNAKNLLGPVGPKRVLISMWFGFLKG